jgi:hypothetical protein
MNKDPPTLLKQKPDRAGRPIRLSQQTTTYRLI